VSYVWSWSAVSQALGQVLQTIFSLLFLASAFGILLKILPDRPIRWRDACLGSSTAAVLFVGGKGLFAYYLSRAGTANTFGAAGALAVILMWLFYSAAVFLFGAELSAAWSQRRDVAALRLVPQQARPAVEGAHD
jgi:membrane protein